MPSRVPLPATSSDAFATDAEFTPLRARQPTAFARRVANAVQALAFVLVAARRRRAAANAPSMPVGDSQREHCANCGCRVKIQNGFATCAELAPSRAAVANAGQVLAFVLIAAAQPGRGERSPAARPIARASSARAAAESRFENAFEAGGELTRSRARVVALVRREQTVSHYLLMSSCASRRFM